MCRLPGQPEPPETPRSEIGRLCQRLEQLTAHPNTADLPEIAAANPQLRALHLLPPDQDDPFRSAPRIHFHQWDAINPLFCAIPFLGQLRELTLTCMALDRAGMSRLMVVARNLRVLRFGQCMLSTEALQLIGGLRRLRRLSIRKTLYRFPELQACVQELGPTLHEIECDVLGDQLARTLPSEWSRRFAHLRVTAQCVALSQCPTLADPFQGGGTDHIQSFIPVDWDLF